MEMRAELSDVIALLPLYCRVCFSCSAAGASPCSWALATYLNRMDLLDGLELLLWMDAMSSSVSRRVVDLKIASNFPYRGWRGDSQADMVKGQGIRGYGEHFFPPIGSFP